MTMDLPLRYRLAVAGVLFLTALVAGAWGSTLVGDEDPTVWGVVLGTMAGATLATIVLVGHRRSSTPPMLRSL
jgi:cyanate permease